jgi:endonuclease/exonuclease/phosphatase family metal-dependent hydrolase
MSAHGSRPLRILSCNIQAGSSTRAYREYITRSWSHVLPAGKRANLDALAELFSPFDLVGLQEADPGSMRSGFDNQSDYLAERGRFPYVSHQANRRISRIAGSGNALLSRLEPTELLDYALPGPVPGRGVLVSRFGKGRDSWVMAVTHLSLGPKSRFIQVGFLAELLAQERRVVLMGDFNCPHDSREMNYLYRHTHLQPPERPVHTFPSWAPDRALDHVLTAGFDIHSYDAVQAAGSDHMAVSVELTPV